MREKGAGAGLSTGYLDEDSDNDAAFSIKAIKEKYRGKGATGGGSN